MAASSLKFLSEAKLAELRRDVPAHRDRYLSGNFRDLERDNGWAIESSSVEVDHEALATLDGASRTAEADIINSLIIHAALKGMTPALAREERVWARLTHVECLDYSRARWLEGTEGERLDAAVGFHMFAPGLTGIRDDNALSRLWWNVHIATIADPNDPTGALKLILKTADIRSNFVERTGTAARKPLAQAVLRAMRTEPWITSAERSFREFMIELNRDGGGVLFEALTDIEADGVLASYTTRARARSE
jgi:Family of unknown function (DUF6339)